MQAFVTGVVACLAVVLLSRAQEEAPEVPASKKRTNAKNRGLHQPSCAGKGLGTAECIVLNDDHPKTTLKGDVAFRIHIASLFRVPAIILVFVFTLVSGRRGCRDLCIAGILSCIALLLAEIYAYISSTACDATGSGTWEAVQNVNFSGVWLRDASLSDPLGVMCDFMQVNQVVRAAMYLLKGVELKQDENYLELRGFFLVPWFNIIERYTLNGEFATVRRRDLRQGNHRGRAFFTDSGQVLNIGLEWSDPLAGWLEDKFTLKGPDEMHVHTTVQISGAVRSVTSVYRRRQRS